MAKPPKQSPKQRNHQNHTTRTLKIFERAQLQTGSVKHYFILYFCL